MTRRGCFLLSFLLFGFLNANAPTQAAEEDTDEPAEEKSAAKREGSSDESAVRGFAGGVKQVAYDGPKDFVKETAGEVPKKPPLVSVVEGVNRGTQKLLDHTVKGAYRVATLGTSELESYEVEEPEKGSGEPTKIKISLPGT